MKIRNTLTWLALLALTTPGWSRGHEYKTLDLADGTKLEYALVLPEGFDPSRTYPVLLGLPPSAQDRDMVEAGLSNGGRSAFRVALEWPERFQSLTVLPGLPPTPRDEDRLERLRGIPVHLFAGGTDKKWVDAGRSTKKRLDKLGIPAELEVFPDEGHVPRSMTAERFLDLLESLRGHE